jgi:hypothetical protein
VAGLTAPARRLQQPSLPTERAAAKIRLDVRGQLTSLINDFCNKIGTPLPFPRCSMFDSYRGRFYRVPELTRPGNVDPEQKSIATGANSPQGLA